MKQIFTSNAGYNKKAENSIKYWENKKSMSYDEIMQEIVDKINSHETLKTILNHKKHIAKIEVIDTHVYILFKSNYTYHGKKIGDVIASILNSNKMFFGMALDKYADTINDPKIAGWCTYNKYTFVSPTLFTPSKPYVRTHTRQQIKALYK